MAEKVAIIIDGEKFQHFDSVHFERHIDDFSSLAFLAPFEADRKEFRKLFKPFSYRSVNGLVNDKVLFTGTLMLPAPRIDDSSKVIDVRCDSLPEVMARCCPPGSAYPLEFAGQTLLQMAQTLASKYGLRAKIDESVSSDESDHAFQKSKLKRGPRGGRGKRGNKFARVALEPGDDAHGFLVKLAQQIGLVAGDNEVGDLVFRDSDATLGNPVADFVQGQSPLVNITPEFRPDQYFSEITAFTPVKVRNKGSKHTVLNPFARGANLVRPHCFKLDSLQTPADGPAACFSRLGRMFGNCASWTIDGIPTWRDPRGELWKPNTTITLLAPDAMIFRKYEFLIRSVAFDQDADTETAALHLVMPGAFSGAMPENLPWDEP